MVAANLDQRSMPVLDLVENAHKRDLELSQVYGKRPGLHLHGGIVALVHAAGRTPRSTQEISDGDQSERIRNMSSEGKPPPSHELLRRALILATTIVVIFITLGGIMLYVGSTTGNPVAYFFAGVCLLPIGFALLGMRRVFKNW